MLYRRTLLLSLLPVLLAERAFALTGLNLTPQDRADLTQVETYLDGLKSLKAHFLQVGPDGQVTQGTVWLERPGRMRFQYDPPTPFLLVAANGRLIFHDPKLGQTSNIPLSRTPLGILLSSHVKLSGDITVTAIQRLPGQFQVSLVRTDSPGEGTLTLVFSENPLNLRQWTVVDAQRQETRVTLYDVQLGVVVDPRLFEFIDPGGAATGGG